MKNDLLTQKVIGCAIEVHKTLGPGLLESTYETCLMYELHQAGVTAERQVLLPINYKNVSIDAGYRLDILLPNKLIIELKSVDKMSPIYSAQILTYMKLTNINAGLLINFNVKRLVDGIKRFNLQSN
ncbi:GxxExxY protein [Psychromonas sp. Urea-02u-13]|uniref:GxxExxY protein n=1 Tax=Psychromonas sp. Urea-02u-13 TaxID=2058326 RepID=UPI000C31FBA0|nr:GxxExxY protein [Psychromonas sp. Urea-02u-13]PKG37511.1 GxxExxY protein [Psychromonas sp. Urea-02u-13]